MLVIAVRCSVVSHRLRCSSRILSAREGATVPLILTRTILNRHYSNQVPQEQNNLPPPSTWRKAVNIIKGFGQGAKLLVGDLKKMRQAKSAMGGFKLSGATPITRPSTDGVTLENIRFIYKTSADIKRTLPTLVLFCIPLIGYVAPFLALLFPGQLLSTHFWSETQKNQLMEKSLERRRNGIKELTTRCEQTDKEDVFSRTVNQISKQNVLQPGAFTTSDKGHLNTLSTAQIHLLSRCWGVSQAIIPLKWFQMRKLRKHLHYIETCDWLLLHRENYTLEQLDTELINELIKERLPLQYPTSSANDELKKWLEIKSLGSTGTKDDFNELLLACMVVRGPEH